MSASGVNGTEILNTIEPSGNPSVSVVSFSTLLRVEVGEGKKINNIDISM